MTLLTIFSHIRYPTCTPTRHPPACSPDVHSPNWHSSARFTHMSVACQTPICSPAHPSLISSVHLSLHPSLGHFVRPPTKLPSYTPPVCLSVHSPEPFLPVHHHICPIVGLSIHPHANLHNRLSTHMTTRSSTWSSTWPQCHQCIAQPLARLMSDTHPPVRTLDCRSRGCGFESHPRQKIKFLSCARSPGSLSPFGKPSTGFRCSGLPHRAGT